MSLFTDEFIENIEKNPIQSVIEICQKSTEHLSELSDPLNEFIAPRVGTAAGGGFKIGNHATPWTEKHLDILMESAALVSAIIETSNVSFPMELPSIENEIKASCVALNDYLVEVEQEFKTRAIENKFSAYQNRFQLAMKSSFTYEFSTGDLDRIQTLIGELRESINKNTFLGGDHKLRLLKKLEKLQLELHKRVSDLNNLMGLVGDAGVLLGKFGTDVKPIVDRLVEIAKIGWRTQANAEELPTDSPSPFIEHDGDA